MKECMRVTRGIDFAKRPVETLSRNDGYAKVRCQMYDVHIWLRCRLEKCLIGEEGRMLGGSNEEDMPTTAFIE